MKHITHINTLKISLILALIIQVSSCTGHKDETLTLYRFIDRLEETNIAASPFKDLTTKLSRIKQQWSSTDFEPLLLNRRKYYALCTQSPVMAWEIKQAPAVIKIDSEEKEIPFENAVESDVLSWTFRKGEHDFDYFEEGREEQDIFVLDENKVLERQVLLPGGDFIVQIWAEGKSQLKMQPQLRVELNNRPIDTISIGPYSSYKITGQAQFGMNSISLFLEKGKGSNDKLQHSVLIDRILIKSLKDIILISPPQENRSFLSVDYSAEYIAEPEDKFSSSLARMSHMSPLPDMSIKENPFNLKKKLVTMGFSKDLSIRILDDAINVLLAPPHSRFEYKLKLSQACSLEFGYGLFNPFWRDSETGVTFSVVIQEGQNEETLFSKNLAPYKKKFYNDVLKERIDLSHYFNKDVTIKFITTSAPSSHDDPFTKDSAPENLEFAFWENPIIFRTLPAETEEHTPPNIILISLDTLRADHLKCYGYRRETSPHIDQLGVDGAVFTNAFSSTSWTLPAHISMLTSLDNRHHGVDKANPFLDSSIVTLADMLRNEDYFTCAITGGALVGQRLGFSKGFDFYREFMRSRYKPNSAKILYNHTNRWLNENKDKRFFLFLHTYQTHAPYTCPEPYNSFFFGDQKMPWTDGDIEKILFHSNGRSKAPFNTLSLLERENIVALYDGEIRYTDENLIKPLIKKLKNLNLYENTMIILTSDHGEEFFDHKAWLHGHSLYNELLHIPLIIKFPQSRYKNRRLHNTVSIIDIMTTILDEVKIDSSAYNFDGVSLIDYLKNGEKEEPLLIADVDSYDNPDILPVKIALFQNGYKLIMNNDFGSPPEFYLPVPPPIAKFELYDMRKDPIEMFNIFEQQSGIVRDLINRITEIYQTKAALSREKRISRDKDFDETMRALGYIR
jgi:arylsulfatase A-like enzyme